MMPAQTPLQKLVKQAVRIKRDLDSLPQHPKLTAEAWTEVAKQQAGCSDADLDKIEKQLASGEMDAIDGLARRIELNVCRSEHYPIPPTKLKRLAEVFGASGILGDLAGAGISVAQLVALAARRASKSHREAFGEISDWAEFQEQVNSWRRQYDDLCQKMREAMTGTDLEIDEDLIEAERQSGLVRVRFARWPGVTLAGDWQQKLVEAELTRSSRRKKLAA